ncbi:GspE/PulE family protein [Clostridium thermobutyricum]|uniref:Type II secretion system protein E n=1 Tax=Clostridium thermobutyricum DSM 4928 TaxID=1121339 RepID=A0A1V4SZ12_9CLOT|nr:ATPase, T2SS/T4P/T4SS family [Clostridium thermobutyricum]OPX50859.1 type II secretion system protein E [Clostridium thermobutyricum DSM 4928]
MGIKKRLGDLLIQNGKITESQLRTALAKQAMSGKRLGEILIENKYITEEDIITTLEMQLGIKRVNLEFIDIDMDIINKVPETLCKKHHIIPLQADEYNICIVTSDPLDLFADDDINIVTGLSVVKVLDTKTSIDSAIAKYYRTQYAKEVARDLENEQIVEDDADKLENLEDEAPIIKFVNTIIQNAIRMEASDIHIEPMEKEIRVRVRIDGELTTMLTAPIKSKSMLITRIKILAKLNIAEKRVPQDGRILQEVDGIRVDLRVSTLPTVHGEKVVIRILKASNELKDKSSLGMDEEDINKLIKILSNTYGIVLVTGPTGSGKSTTLYSVLGELNSIDKNIITVEDPVEFTVDGINQVNVNPKAGMTFALGLKSILRQDPDVIMIGEIRDTETAEIAARAAITGHIVLSTLHTNDAASTIVRLIDMGIEPYLISTSLVGVIAQRLVRKVCKRCAKKYEASDYEKKLLNVQKEEKLLLKKGEGCSYCNNTGYKGRTGIYEILNINRELRESIINNEDSDSLKEIGIKNGMKTLNKACIEKVIQGVTTIDELMRVAYLRE